MADLNKVFLMGRLTADPELRRTPTGIAVSQLRLASTRKWMGRDGERREDTLFIDVTVWDRQAENCCQFLRKGSAIHVEGSLKMDTWDDKTTGEKRSKILVHADPGGVQFLDSRRSDSSGGGGGGGGGVNLDDELSPHPQSQSARDAGMRRSPPAPARPAGDGYGYGEPRGPSNGPSRAPYPPSGPAGQPPLNDDRDDDDIPF